MRKQVTLFFLCTCTASLQGQNVGIDIANLLERLHVRGNVRIDGNATRNGNPVLRNSTLRITTSQLLTTPVIVSAFMNS